MMPITLMKVTLLALVIVTYVGPSAGPPQDDEDFEVPDSDDPWAPELNDQSEFQESEFSRDRDILEDHDLSKSEDYYNLEDPQVEPKMNQMLKDTYKNIPSEDFLDALDYFPLIGKANGNPTSELDFKRMIHFPWSKDRKGKNHGSSKTKSQYCRISPPTGRPGCHGSTTDRCSSTFSLPPSSPSCPYTPKPTAPPPMSPPPPPPPTPKPPPCREKSSKGRQKPGFRTLNPKTAKMLLKIIMDTKQHVLFALEILNHMENEVLFRSPDTCHRQDCNIKSEVPEKGRTVPKKKPEKPQKFQSYDDYHRKSPSSMPMAKAKQHRHKEHLAFIDPQDNWCPASPNQANRPKKLLENALQPMGLNRHSYKKYRNHGQKQQSKMKKIPPGMVAILA